MLNIGPAEVLVIALIALIVVGPEQLPGVLRKLGKSAGQLRHMADGLKKDFMSGMEELDPTTWTEEKPRGKGTVTDPIIGPGAYGGGPGSPTAKGSEVEGKSTRQLAQDRAAKDGAAKDGAAKDGAAEDGAAKDGAARDEAAARDDQPVTKPVTESDFAPDEPAPAEQADLVDPDEGVRPQ